MESVPEGDGGRYDWQRERYMDKHDKDSRMESERGRYMESGRGLEMEQWTMQDGRIELKRGRGGRSQIQDKSGLLIMVQSY